MKKYIFNNLEYTNLNDLGLAYIENFDLAVKDLKTNSVKLLSFIKTKNKKIYKESLDIFYSCKYAANVITLFIYLFVDEKVVCINGKKHSFDDFVDGFKKNNGMYKKFILDQGIERTYVQMYPQSELAINAPYIRRHINDPFVEDYISNYFNVDGLDNIATYIKYSDKNELFNKVNGSFDSRDLQLILAHKYGLKNVLDMRNEYYPIFNGLKLVENILDYEEVSEILTNTHFVWLFNNYEKYGFKRKAKYIVKTYKERKKEYKNVLKNQDKNLLIDFMSKLAKDYFEFVKLYKQNLIYVKKNFEKEEYDLNVLYCYTYICKASMKELNIVIVNEDVNEAKVKEAKEEPKQINEVKERKRINKLGRFNKGIIFFNILALLYLIFVIVASIFNLVEFYLPLADATLDYVFIGLLVLLLLFSAVLASKVEKSKNAFNKVIRLKNLLIEENEINNKETEIAKLANKHKKNIKRTIASRRIITAIMCAMFAFVYSVIILNVFNTFLGDTLDQFVDWTVTWNTNSSGISYVVCAPVLAFLYGLIRKKKGFLTSILLILIAVIGVLIPVLL